jgi:hypothetical protein
MPDAEIGPPDAPAWLAQVVAAARRFGTGDGSFDNLADSVRDAASVPAQRSPLPTPRTDTSAAANRLADRVGERPAQDPPGGFTATQYSLLKIRALAADPMDALYAQASPLTR